MAEVQSSNSRPKVQPRSRWKGQSKSISAPRIVHVSYDVVNDLLDEPPVSTTALELPLTLPPAASDVKFTVRGTSGPSHRTGKTSSTWLWLLVYMVVGAILALAVFRTLGMLPVSAAAMNADKVVALKPSVAESRLLPKQQDVVDARLFDPLPASLSLGSFVGQFVRMVDVPISIDVESLRYSRAGLETSISPQAMAGLRGSTLSTLAATLRPFDLKCFALQDQVVIRGAAEDRRLRRALHDVSDLQPQADGGLDLVGLISQIVDQDSWQGHGGSGGISLNGDVLAVYNTSRVHRDVLVLCETLRNSRGLPRVSRVDIPLTVNEVRDELSQLDSIRVQVYVDRPCPLPEVLAMLGKSSGHTFLVNWLALEQASPMRFEECRVALNADGIRLSEALDRITAQLGATFRCVGKKTIEITTSADELNRDCILVQRLPVGFDPRTFSEQVRAEMVSQLPDHGDRFWVDVAGERMISRLPQSRQITLADWLAARPN